MTTPITRVFLAFLILCSCTASGQIITTIAGGGADEDAYGVPALSASIKGPIGIATDAAGNVYIGDRDRHRIRKINPAGIITTIAGTGIPGYSGDGGPATAAEINYPYGVFADGAGNIYFADGFNFCVRKISNTGNITTVAGTGVGGYNGDNIAATAAMMEGVGGVVADAAGNIYITNGATASIRKVSTSGIITTIAGTGTAGHTGDGGAATAATLREPYGITMDEAGNIYIAEDRGNCIRKINRAGIISTVAGTGVAGYNGDNIPATDAQLKRSTGIAVAQNGDLYIADADNNRIRRVDAAGTITTIAGTGVYGYSGDGSLAVAAQLASPSGVAIDNRGNIYIADFVNSRIRLLTNTVAVTEILKNQPRIDVYPNPATSNAFTVNIISNNTQEVPIIIMDITGKQINETKINPNSPSYIKLNTPPGIYFLSAIVEGQKMVEKIVLSQ